MSGRRSVPEATLVQNPWMDGGAAKRRAEALGQHSAAAAMQDDEDVQILSSTAAPISAASSHQRVTRSTSSSQHVPAAAAAAGHNKAPRMPQRVPIPRPSASRAAQLLKQQREQAQQARYADLISRWDYDEQFTIESAATRSDDITAYGVWIDTAPVEDRHDLMRDAWKLGVTFAELPGPGKLTGQRILDLGAFTALLRTTDGENRWPQLESAWNERATFNETMNPENDLGDQDAFWEWIRGDEGLPNRTERLRQLWEHDARYIRDDRVSVEQQGRDHDAHVAWFRGVYGRDPPAPEDENIEIPPSSDDEDDGRPPVSPAQKHAARASAVLPSNSAAAADRRERMRALWRKKGKHVNDPKASFAQRLNDAADYRAWRDTPEGMARHAAAAASGTSSAEFARYVGWLRGGIPPDPATGRVRRTDDAAYRAWLLTPEGSELAAAEDGIRTRPGSPAFDAPAIQSTQMMEMRLVDQIFAVKTRAAAEVDRLRREADMNSVQPMTDVIKHVAKQTEERLQAKLDRVRGALETQQRIRKHRQTEEKRVAEEDAAAIRTNKRGEGWLTQRKADIDRLRFTPLFEQLLPIITRSELKAAHGVSFDPAVVASQLFLGVTVDRSPVYLGEPYGTHSYVLRINLCGAGFIHPIQGGWIRLTLDDDPTKGVYLNYFYSNRASGEDGYGYWAAMRRMRIEPRGFMVPVMRAFLRDHWLRRDDVAPNASFRLDAVGSAGGGANDQDKLVDYYKTLGFEVTDHPSPRYIGYTHAMATTIETFLARTAHTDTANANASKQAQIWRVDFSQYNARRIQVPAIHELKRFHHPLVHPVPEGAPAGPTHI